MRAPRGKAQAPATLLFLPASDVVLPALEMFRYQGD